MRDVTLFKVFLAAPRATSRGVKSELFVVLGFAPASRRWRIRLACPDRAAACRHVEPF